MLQIELESKAPISHIQSDNRRHHGSRDLAALRASHSSSSMSISCLPSTKSIFSRGVNESLCQNFQTARRTRNHGTMMYAVTTPTAPTST